MIHYHGTPIGGKRHDAIYFLTGRHALVSFRRQDDIGIVAEYCSSFVLDNGAFSAWKSGSPIIEWEPYYAFVDKWRRHPSFDWAIIPDVIEGSEADNDRLIAEWPFPYCGVPVWHFHETIDRLRTLASSYHRIALGSSGEWRTPGTPKWWDRMNVVMDAVCDNGEPNVKLHGLRMLNPAIFGKIPLSSADSTNAAVNGTRKAIQVGCSDLLGRIIIADKIESYQSSSHWKARSKQNYMNLFE